MAAEGGPEPGAVDRQENEDSASRVLENLDLLELSLL